MSGLPAKLRTNGHARAVREDVKGAPLNIGQAVRVVALADETADKALLRKVGVTEHFEYSCGCGQSYPHDPMIGVRFSNGRLEEFWIEELEANPESTDCREVRDKNANRPLALSYETP